ncbi:MAG: adenosine deaminase, partial [Lachnospiraceae bacterium]|nr:adenosine deaminase [Lachnospiraceae bacterium]
QMEKDRKDPAYADYTLFQDKLLWIARGLKRRGILYAEISDTTLVKPGQAAAMLGSVHEAMPAITAETGVTIRFLAAIRRIPLTIVRDQIGLQGDFREQLRVLEAVACDPYVAGSDIIGEEMNDIRDLRPVLSELVRIAGGNPGFTLRIHAGENDSLPDNVANSLRCVREALKDGQKMPDLRIGHGLYTANLRSAKGQKLIRDLREYGVVLEFQITSNVRLNNLSILTHHPLKQYLQGGISCVQGTDGGAIYGTDSIDEQLTLEKLLELSREELLAMRRAEDRVLEKSLRTFDEKKSAFGPLAGGRTVEEFLTERIRAAKESDEPLYSERGRTESAVCLESQIREMPLDKVPVVLLGGSFNSDHHTTRMREPLRELIRDLTERMDPERVFFVVGHHLTAYEMELVRQAGGRFEIFAIVPTRITLPEAERLKRSGAGIRISIEPTGMGLYKSFAYEIFKRRPSVVIGIDGNSAGANIIQEAKNGKKKARIFVCRHARILRAKAQTLQGYVRLFDGPDASEEILAAVSSVMKEVLAQ